MYFKHFFCLIFCFILMICSCKNSYKIIRIDPRFAEHITGYSSGMISTNNTIKIELASALTTNENNLPDSNLLKNAFHFSPSIKGKAIWVNNRTIEFIPAEKLESATFYNASFNLGKFKNVPSDLKKFKFQFSTYEQHLYVKLDGLRSKNGDIEWQELTGSIKTTDKIDTSYLHQLMDANYLGKKLKVQFDNYVSSENEIRFTIDSIQCNGNENAIQLSWNGKKINATEYGNETTKVPSLNDYNVVKASVKEDENDNYLEIEFSTPLLYTQNLNGIIKVSDVENPSFVIEGNIVKVFFKERILGTKTLTIESSIKNSKAYTMKESYSNEIEFFPAKPKVRIVGSGCILPNSQGLIFPFETINLKTVEVRVIKIFENNVHQFLQVNDLNGNDGLTRVGKIVAEKKFNLDYNKQDLTQWTKHVIDLNKLITPDPGSIYRVSIKFEKKDIIYSCDTTENELSEESIETISETETDKNWNEDNWNENSFDDYETWENYNDDYSPCENSYYYGKAVSRNILASDIGMIFKLDENKMSHVFVSNLITTEPLSNTVIEFYDYTKQLIAKGNTDANGIANIFLPQKPFLLIAKNGKQRGYLKLLEASANSLTKFDIEGDKIQQGIKGFLYTERGVYRPGDSMYINFILEDKLNTLPQNYPVQFVLNDPQGKIVYETTTSNHVNHTYDFRTATTSNAITGNYLAKVKVGNNEYTKTIHVETVKPNRLKIKINLPETIYENSDSNQFLLQAKWLHGANAKNLKASMQATLQETETSFANLKNYIFTSPLKKYNSTDIQVFENKLNENGEATVPLNLKVGNNAPGILKATFVTKVFEEGGDFSIDKFSTNYSPFKKYVGIELPTLNNNEQNYVANKNYTFNVASVNANGSLDNSKKLHLKIYKIEWRWWYETDDDDASSYLSKSSTIMIKDTFLSTTNGKANFNFTSTENNYARYLIVLTDEEGGHQTGSTISFDYPYWEKGNQNFSENASMLHFSCDKKTYKKGEAIKITIPSPAVGKALISIEKGNKVLQTYWINTIKGETKYEVMATADMTPNVYIHITLIQPHINTINDLPIRMYGIVGIKVVDENTILHPIISMADVVKPETKNTISVKEMNGKKITYTLAIVDEGLLDLTRFTTPNAWNTFYAKEALGVKTWDVYDNVIGAYAGKLDHLLSIGGDASYDGSNTTKANRFIPMVKFLGPFTLEANQTNNHTIEIPNYIGSIKVMLVAQNNGTYGNAEKVVTVKKPLMLLATMPRTLTPNDEISIPVDVFAMEKNVKDVKVEISCNDFLQLKNGPTQNIHFNTIGDEVIDFKIKVANKVGIAKIKVKATCGNETAIQEMEIDVRMPNPVSATTQDFEVNGNAKINIALANKFMQGTNATNIEISTIPHLNIDKRLDYLIQYPHGCIEQTTSSVFPQLYISSIQDVNEKQQKAIELNIKKAIEKLKQFQTSSGGFSYWPGENIVSEFGTNYAGHFLLEAEKSGYAIPITLKQNWIKYQTQQAKNWSSSSSNFPTNETNNFIQAYRLYTLTMCNNAVLGSMNQLRENKNLNSVSKAMLSLAYQQIGQNEVAKQMLYDIKLNTVEYKELSYSYGSDTRDNAIILLASSQLKNTQLGTILINKIIEKMNNENALSTQETAYCLLSIINYYGINQNNTCNFNYQFNNKVVTVNNKKSVSIVNFSENEITANNTLTLQNNSTQKMYVRVINKGVPMQADTTVSNKNISIKVVYKNMKGEIINPNYIKQGTDFNAEVSIKNISNRGLLKEMCLNELFPSGWEIHNKRFLGTSENNTAIRYQDIRDDRVYSYFDLDKNSEIKINISLNATYKGKYFMPSIYSEAMYDASIHANTKPMWVEVGL